MPRPLVPRTPGQPDLAAARAARLPGQLWPDWAVRLTGDCASGASRHDKFLPAALIALLLRHSGMPLNQVTTMVSGQLIPIAYQRRRYLAAGTTLIDDATWARMIREAWMRLAPAGIARRYLYELLTGCGLGTAPPPYRLTSAESQGRYNDFAIGMAASLTTAPADHARACSPTGESRASRCDGSRLMTGSVPPLGRVRIPHTLTPAPSTTPCCARTPRRARSRPGWASPWITASGAAAAPAARPRRPVRHTLIPRPAPASPPPGQQPGVLYLDPAWLREEYLTWHRSLNDIAGQIGCPIQTLNRFAHDHGIPVRTRGTSIYTPAASAPGLHPRDLPEPLRSALIGPRARRRLDHLLISAGHASILQGAQALRIWQSTLYEQVARLERACGGPLINRSPRPPGHRNPDPAR